MVRNDWNKKKEEQYFLREYNLPIRFRSRIGAKVLVTCESSDFHLLIQEAKNRIDGLKKHCKNVADAFSSIKDLEKTSHLYATRLLINVDPEKQIITARSAKEIHEDLINLLQKTEVVFKEAIEIEKQIISHKPPKTGGQVRASENELLRACSESFQQ